MTCTEEYKEHIEYTFHAFCKIVIRNASYTALRTWSRKHKREISLDYITDEKHYPLGTTDEYFKAPEPDEEYIVHLCGDNGMLQNIPLLLSHPCLCAGRFDGYKTPTVDIAPVKLYPYVKKQDANSCI